MAALSIIGCNKGQVFYNVFLCVILKALVYANKLQNPWFKGWTMTKSNENDNILTNFTNRVPAWWGISGIHMLDIIFHNWIWKLRQIYLSIFINFFSNYIVHNWIDQNRHSLLMNLYLNYQWNLSSFIISICDMHAVDKMLTHSN